MKLNLMQISPYLGYLMLAGFVIGAVQTSWVLDLQMTGWHSGMPDWFVMCSYLLNIPGGIGEIGASQFDTPDTVTISYILECALLMGALNALFYAAFGAIIRYSFLKIRRCWGGARRLA